MAQLFPGGRVVKPQVPPELFPVFATPTAAEVTKAFASFQELQVAKGSQFLKATGHVSVVDLRTERYDIHAYI